MCVYGGNRKKGNGYRRRKTTVIHEGSQVWAVRGPWWVKGVFDDDTQHRINGLPYARVRIFTHAHIDVLYFHDVINGTDPTIVTLAHEDYFITLCYFRFSREKQIRLFSAFFKHLYNVCRYLNYFKYTV